jgi:hypothetical protein
MTSAIRNQYEALETSRKEIFDELRAYSEAVLNKKPSPEAWSVLQVLDHLLMAEEFSLSYLKKKTQDTSQLPAAGFGSQYRLTLVRIAFVLPRAFAAPKTLDPPNAVLSLADLENRWSKVRTETFQLLNQLPDPDLKKEIWKHAVAGKMNIRQMYAFLGMHIDRHRKQIDRTLKAVK